MKYTIKTILAAGVAALALLPAVQAEESAGAIIVKTAPENAVGFDGAEKLFAEKTPDVVFQLQHLTPEQLTRVAQLPDTDRLSTFSEKKQKEEYHYTLDSAADQALKEEEDAGKEDTGDAAAAAAADTKDQPGTTSFFTAVTRKGITFAFCSTTLQPARYEVILSPIEEGRFGGAGLHFWMDQNAVSAKLTGWRCIKPLRYTLSIEGNPIHPQITFRPETARTGEGYIMTKCTVPWGDIYQVLGEVPLKAGRSVQWKLSVFRWAKTGSATLRGIPHEGADTYMMFPVFTPKVAADIKGSVTGEAVSYFYFIDRKHGNLTRTYFDYMMNQTKSLPFWKERFKVIYRLGFPLSFSEFYLSKFPRKVPKEIIGDSEKTADQNFRLMEWEEEMQLRGNVLRTYGSSPALADELLRLETERFGFPLLGYEELQMEAMKDRVFTEKFLQEE